MNKYEYAIKPGGNVIFRANSIKNGYNEKIFYKGLSDWKENDDLELSALSSWIVPEDEALKAAINLGMSKENFYK